MNLNLPLVLLGLGGLIGCSPSTDPAAPLTLNSLAGPGTPTGLVYAPSRLALSVGRTLAPISPSVSGTGLVFTVAPSLPVGLSLDSTTGTISGTPARPSATTRYVVSAANFAGASTFALFVTVLDFPAILEPNHAGNAASVRLVSAQWGRLVDVYSREPATGNDVLRARNVVIGEDIQSDGSTFLLETNLALQYERVVILRAFGSAAFQTAFEQLEAGLVTVAPKAPDDLPPFSAVPRNAALVLRFDDLLDPTSIDWFTIRTHVGKPPIGPNEARTFADPNHGGVADRDHDGKAEFYPTRVVVDFSTSAYDYAYDTTIVSGSVNTRGLPANETPTVANVLLRLPTLIDPPSGQFHVLHNLAQNALSFTGNGPTDPGSVTEDVIRAFRSGNPDIDLYRGFLRDASAPAIVGVLDGYTTLIARDESAGPAHYRADLLFSTPSCATALRPGDTLNVQGVILEVVTGTAAPTGAILSHVLLRRIAGGEPVGSLTGFFVRFDPTLHAGREGCFVSRTTLAGQAGDEIALAGGPWHVNFSEPIEPSNIDPVEALRLAKVAVPAQASDFVVARTEPSLDVTVFQFTPVAGLFHAAGGAEEYFFSVSNLVHDLGGNALGAPLVNARLRMHPSAGANNAGGIVLRFGSSDELGANGLPELRGQFQFDFTAERIRPRPVTRFSATADRTQPTIANMIALTSGVQTPLTPFGAKLHSLWRYCDVGFGLLDETTTNVDVEGLAWAPLGGVVVADHVANFRIDVGHSSRLPDESLDITLLPRHPNSGAVATFEQNVLDPASSPLHNVHPGTHGATGYSLIPSDAYLSSTGTWMMPYPWNRGIPVSDQARYTWRDTAILARGGLRDSPGVELPIVRQLAGLPPAPPIYGNSDVPTIGLPLLMEFRCYPDFATLGLNSFDVSLAVPSSPRPSFRAFSAGGINTSGMVVVVHPDLANVATGGFNPNSIPTAGTPTPPLDNVVYLGEMDLVTRISRVHTIWFDSGLVDPYHPQAVLWPEEQPAGTNVELAFRAATSLNGSAALGLDAASLDPYGDPRPGSGLLAPAYSNGNAGWRTYLDASEHARFVQVRLTFVANVETGTVPEISSLGMGWQVP